MLDFIILIVFFIVYISIVIKIIDFIDKSTKI